MFRCNPAGHIHDVDISCPHILNQPPDCLFIILFSVIRGKNHFFGAFSGIRPFRITGYVRLFPLLLPVRIMPHNPFVIPDSLCTEVRCFFGPHPDFFPVIANSGQIFPGADPDSVLQKIFNQIQIIKDKSPVGQTSVNGGTIAFMASRHPRSFPSVIIT